MLPHWLGCFPLISSNLIFAEVGRSQSSSSASEDLIKSIINYYSKNSLFDFSFYYFPVFNISDTLNYFLSIPFKKKTNERRQIISTSIKYIRDIVYIASMLFLCKKNRPSNVFLYNITNFQSLIFRSLTKLIYFECNFILIQADGYILRPFILKAFGSVISFSCYSQRIYYKKLKEKSYFAYPLISSQLKASYCPKISNEKIINIVHCGSISNYNVPINALNLLKNLCIENTNIKIHFTSSQSELPDYFIKFLRSSPPNILFLGKLAEIDLKMLLEKSNIGLDLRSPLAQEQSNFCDFPSKILLYYSHDLIVFSNKPYNIPIQMRNSLLPISALSNITNIKYNKYNDYFSASTDHLYEFSLDNVLDRVINNLKN